MRKKWPRGGNPWTVKDTRVLHEDGWLKLEGQRVIRPDDSEGDYNVVRLRQLGVGVLPIDERGVVTMIGQWRLPLGRYSWEMPQGGREEDEDAIACAKRELKEEAGLEATHWIKALELDLSTSLTDARSVAFVATGLSAGAAQPEACEVLNVRRAHFRDVLDRVSTHEIREASTVATVLRAYQMAASGELPEPLARAMLSKR